MLTIRALTQADLMVADEIMRAAYQTTQSRLQPLTQNRRLQPDGWIIAELDGVPVGLVGAVNYSSFAYIGSMSVLPTMQRRGIGRMLIQHLLDWLDYQQCPTVFLDASPSGALLYEQFGFVDEDTCGHWYRPQNHSLIYPFIAQSKILPLEIKHLDELAAFDIHYFGANRTRVFSQFKLEYAEEATIARDEAGNINGYLFVHGQTLGPWVAINSQVAEDLLNSVLHVPDVIQPTIFVPGANVQAAALLERYGFRLQRVLRHMRRGQPISLRDRTKIYGQASFSLG